MLRRYIVTGIVLLFLLSSIIPMVNSYGYSLTKIKKNIYDDEWFYDVNTGGWHIEFPANITNYSISWKVNIRNQISAYLVFKHQYEFNHISNEEVIYDSFGYLEISSDDGNNWIIMDVFEDDSKGIVEERYDFSSWDDESIIIRFRVEGIGDSDFIYEYGGMWSFWDFMFKGMRDYVSPISHCKVTGNMYVGRDGWRYDTPDYYELSTYDDFSGIREFIIIHNNSITGTEVTVLNKPYFNFSLLKNGINDFYFWGVDLCGNIGKQFNLTPCKVDMERPTVEIIAPESGLYIFNRKILPLKKPLIIGDFKIKVDAFDGVSGIYSVEFFLDGYYEEHLIGIDYEEPFEINCNIRHYGEGKISVAVEDVALNSVGETIEIDYYNFF